MWKISISSQNTVTENGLSLMFKQPVKQRKYLKHLFLDTGYQAMQNNHSWVGRGGGRWAFQCHRLSWLWGSVKRTVNSGALQKCWPVEGPLGMWWAEVASGYRTGYWRRGNFPACSRALLRVSTSFRWIPLTGQATAWGGGMIAKEQREKFSKPPWSWE